MEIIKNFRFTDMKYKKNEMVSTEIQSLINSLKAKVKRKPSGDLIASNAVVVIILSLKKGRTLLAGAHQKLQSKFGGQLSQNRE